MMRTRRSILASAGSVALSLTVIGTATAADDQTRYLLATRGNGAIENVEAAGFEVVAELAGGDVLRVTGPAGAAGDLGALSGVRAAVTDAVFEVGVPEAIETVDQLPDGVHEGAAFAENQWDKLVTEVPAALEYATGAGSLVGVIDTGVETTHPDLEDNVESAELVTSLDPIPGDDTPEDTHGHGTNVAGIAAATGALGVHGTAPEAGIASYKVFVLTEIEGEVVLATTTGDILESIDRAAAAGADAANLSLGTAPIPPQGNVGGFRTVYERVIQHATRAGTLVVASAGNDAANLQQGGYFTVPNSVAGAMSISATAPNDDLTYYSNFGTNEIDVGAPGGGYGSLEKTLCAYEEWLDAESPLLISLDPREPGQTGTLWLDESGVPTTNPDAVDESVNCIIPEWPVPFNFVFNAVDGESWAWFAGTSMSAPQVTGLAALVRELDPDRNARRVEQAIKRGAEGASGQADPEVGAGRINALQTVRDVAGE